MSMAHRCIFQGVDDNFDQKFIDAFSRRQRNLSPGDILEYLEEDIWEFYTNKLLLDDLPVVRFYKIGMTIFCSSPAWRDDVELLEQLIVSFYEGSIGIGWRKIGQDGPYGFQFTDSAVTRNGGWTLHELDGETTHIYDRA